MIKQIAIVGATGQLGRLVYETLLRRNFPVQDIVLLNLQNEKTTKADINGQPHTIHSLKDHDFNATQLAFFCTTPDIYHRHVPKALDANCTVIDAVNHDRFDPQIPMIIPEVNADTIENYQNKNVISGAHCAAVQMLMALKPLDDAATITRIASTAQLAVSGLGYKATDELLQTTQIALENEQATPDKFPRALAFNVIPQTESFMDNGQTRTEFKIEHDIAKVLGRKIPMHTTATRVPVHTGHAVSMTVTFEKSMSAEKARALLSAAEGINVQDGEDYITPLEAAGSDTVYVNRLRDDPSLKNTITLWVVADNLRKGAATNIVQIAECWLDYVTEKESACTSTLGKASRAATLRC